MKEKCCPSQLQRKMDLCGPCCAEAAEKEPTAGCACTQEGGPQIDRPDVKQRFVQGSVQTAVGRVPQVSASLVWADHWGTFKARWGVGRMHYTVDPGLYAVGYPDERSHVLVTANYKMSFDRLREVLPGRDTWILVLDTNGINVWCAAGKGTFGTQELVACMERSGLAQVVSHKELVLPQLGASGVAAHQVKKLTGFKVIYGPIRARDLPAFLDGGLRGTPEMRRKTFRIGERVALIPVELVSALKWAVITIVVLFFLGGLLGPGAYWSNALNSGTFAAVATLTAILAGAVLTPMLLPWLPGRAFSLKGTSLGLLGTAVLMGFRLEDLNTGSLSLERLALFFLVPAMAAFLAMNFTGASTYTSLSGVRKEMRWALPLQIAACVVGLGLWVGSRLMA